MSKISLFSQILMIVVAITIVVMYIKPTIANLRTLQETTDTYNAESDKVSDVNIQLKNKIAIVESVRPADIAALNRYIPDTVDEIAVMKDLSAILKGLNLPADSIKFDGMALPAESTLGTEPSTLTSYNFSIATDISYADLKKLLAAIEINNYLLQITSLTVTPNIESETLEVAIKLKTFSRTMEKSADGVTE